MRIALGVEYDGRCFHGWQRQEHVASIQASLEDALSKVADEPIQVHCAGRTDRGVHALEQVVHFDTHSQRSDRSWMLGTNANMAESVSVRWARPVTEEFHARFSALSRTYRYVILNSPTRPSFAAGRVTWDFRPLDEARMHRAGQCLLGELDFTSFRAVACQSKTPMRNVTHLSVTRKDDLVIMDIRANAFLHHMVRNIAGVLMSIGCGEQPEAWVQQVLEARDRTQGGVTAPPQGLYLMSVEYPDEFGIPQVPPTRLVW